MASQLVVPPRRPAALSRLRRLWPMAVIIAALALTAAWMLFLGYGFIALLISTI